MVQLCFFVCFIVLVGYNNIPLVEATDVKAKNPRSKMKKLTIFSLLIGVVLFGNSGSIKQAKATCYECARDPACGEFGETCFETRLGRTGCTWWIVFDEYGRPDDCGCSSDGPTCRGLP